MLIGMVETCIEENSVPFYLRCQGHKFLQLGSEDYMKILKENHPECKKTHDKN